MERPRLGIALGGGAARGWAHIGVLRALAEQGIEPAVISGTSIGALVGGIYAVGKLAELAEWAVGLTRRDVFSLVDFGVGRGGAIGGQKLMDLYREHLGETDIASLPRRFGAVATDLETGAEIWITEGPLHAAIRASTSLPGVFTPAPRDGRWLVDGGLVDPVPVSLCRALGAEVVIAVDVNGRPPLPYPLGASAGAADEAAGASTMSGASRPHPKLREVIVASLEIMQDRITRSRLAGDPPELLLRPRVGHLPLLDFVDGRATIDEGYATVQRMLPALTDLLGGGTLPPARRAVVAGRSGAVDANGEAP